MNPLWLLLIGMVVVVGSVLLLRLHVFLVMILGAIVVSLLTPATNVQRSALRDRDKLAEFVFHDRVDLNGTPGIIYLAPGKQQRLLVGSPLIVLRQQDDGTVDRV